MCRWDLTTDEIHFFGENEGYSVPFSSGTSAVLIPMFITENGALLVSWGWFGVH